MQPYKRTRCSTTLTAIYIACLILIGIVSALVYLPQTAAAEAGAQSPSPHANEWPMGGQNLGNTWNQPFEKTIGPSNVSQLVTKWVFTTKGDVSATPAVVNGV